MALVERAHGGHERDGCPGRTAFGDEAPELRDGRHDERARGDLGHSPPPSGRSLPAPSIVPVPSSPGRRGRPVEPRPVEARAVEERSGIVARQRVLDCAAHERGEDRAGTCDADAVEQPARLVDDGGRERDGRVDGLAVRRSIGLGDHERLAAHLDDERLADGQHRGRSRDREPCAGQPSEVDGRAGERHRRVHGQGDRAHAECRFEDPRAEAGRRVQHELARLPDARVGQACHERCELLLGHGEEHELAALDDLGDGQHGNAGEHGGRALPARLRHGGDPGEGVARAGQGGREHGADPAGADRADAEPPCTFSGHRPTPCVALRRPSDARCRMRRGPRPRRPTARTARTPPRDRRPAAS